MCKSIRQAINGTLYCSSCGSESKGDLRVYDDDERLTGGDLPPKQTTTNRRKYIFLYNDGPSQRHLVLDQKDEIEQDVDEGHEYLTAAVVMFGDGLLNSDVPPEIEGETLSDQLDCGETAALRGAVEYGGTIATDDLATRRLEEKLGVPVTRSILFPKRS